ncbi:hypothetical protein L1887_06814 [Cichorium endivia]|nr:hypothetical protein L1887_06814 [Cichorium endivia]
MCYTALSPCSANEISAARILKAIKELSMTFDVVRVTSFQKYHPRPDDLRYAGRTAYQPGPNATNQDEAEEILAEINPSVIIDDPIILNDGTSFDPPMVNDDTPAESPKTVVETPVVEETVIQTEDIKSGSTDLFNSTVMDSLFLERIPDEYAASTSYDFRTSDRGDSAAGRVENITNLLVSSEALEHAIPSRIQCDHLVEIFIGSLTDGVQTRSQSGYVNECLYSSFISQIEPNNVEMALNEPSWVDAMHEELNQFETLKVWQLVELPEGKKSLDTTWIEGLNYTEVYAPLARLEAIHILLAYVSYIGFTVHLIRFQMDVYKLDKALYGLHQAPRAWYATLTEHLLQHGYTRGMIVQTLFIKRENSYLIVVQIYVDDIIFGSTSEEQVMKKIFEMSSLGEMTMFLGLQAHQSSKGILLHQGKYVDEIMEKFTFKDTKVAATPMAERPLLTSDPDGESTNPKLSHLIAVKRIFRYLKGRPKLGLCYPKNREFDLYAFFDSNYGVCDIDRRSTSVGCQFLGDRLISWQCKKQQTVSTSTAETEYVSALACCSQVIRMQHQLLYYGLNFLDTPIFCDKDAAILIVKNPVQHSKTKQSDIKVHFIRDCYERKLIHLEQIHTDKIVADLFTEPFAKARFDVLVGFLKMIRFDD